MIFLKKSCIGIDVGIDTIHVIELAKEKEKLRIHYLAASFSRHNKHDFKNILSPCTAKKAVICLPAEKTASALFYLKKPLSELEIELSIQQGIENYLPHFTEHDYYDYQINHSTSESYNIELIATQKSWIEPLLIILKKQNIRLLTMTLHKELICNTRSTVPDGFIHAHTASLQGLS